MKVLHVPFCYYPDAVGGTEVYVASLAQAQLAAGTEVAIAAPGDRNRSYHHDGIEVHRYANSRNIELRSIYGAGDVEALRNFLAVLERSRPDVVHLHAFTSGVSAQLAHAVRRGGTPVVFTYHTPAITCIRGTLLRWGGEICDGEMRVGRCAACVAHGKGMPKVAARILGNLPPALGSAIGNARLRGSLWTALRGTELAGLLHSAARKLLREEASHVFAVCGWVRDLLITNGVPPEKITLSRQGISHLPERVSKPAGRVRFAFLGRLNAAKGVRILIEAFRALPDLDASLDVFGIVQDTEANGVKTWLLEQARRDCRVQLLAPLAASEVIARLGAYDALLVPSQALETGPLVVYEAFAAGIPVIGSALGGIAELVADGQNGILLPPSDIGAWSDTITKLVKDPALLAKLKAAPKPVRTMSDAASEVSAVYTKILTPSHVSSCSMA